MTQVTWRAPDELVDDLRRVASAAGMSLNEYLTRLAQAATDPMLAGSDVERLRERLARAGLLVTGPRRSRRPPQQSVERARHAAGQGTPPSDLVVAERR